MQAAKITRTGYLEGMLVAGLLVIPAVAAAQEDAHEPITSGFGIPLGKPFLPVMVEQVVEHNPGNRKILVLPKKTHPLFTRYVVKTAGARGLVESVTGHHDCNKNDPEPIEDFENLKRAMEEKYGPSTTVKLRDERKKPRKNKGWVYQSRIRIDQGHRSVLLDINTGFNYTCFIEITFMDKDV